MGGGEGEGDVGGGDGDGEMGNQNDTGANGTTNAYNAMSATNTSQARQTNESKSGREIGYGGGVFPYNGDRVEAEGFWKGIIESQPPLSASLPQVDWARLQPGFVPT